MPNLTIRPPHRRKPNWTPFQLRRRLAEAFPGAFLIQKRCKCRLHQFGEGPDAELVAEVCPRCRRYAWFQAQQAQRTKREAA